MIKRSPRYDLYRFCVRLHGNKVDRTSILINYELRGVQEALRACRVPPALRQERQEYLWDLELLQLILHTGVIPGECSSRFLNSVTPVLEQLDIKFEDGRPCHVIQLAGKAADEEVEKISRFLQGLVGSTLTARYFFQNVDVMVLGSEKQWEAETVQQIIRRLDEYFPFWLFFMTQKNSNLRTLLRCLCANHPEACSAYSRDALMVLLQEKWLPAMHWLCRYAHFIEMDIRVLFDQTLKYLYPLPARTQLTVKSVEKVTKRYCW